MGELDDHVRGTMNALVRFAIACQPLPETALALERPEFGISAAPTAPSLMPTGRSVYDYDAHLPGDSAAAHLTAPGVEGNVTTPEAIRTTTAASSGDAVVARAESSMQTETMLLVDDGLTENTDFDERLSQQFWSPVSFGDVYRSGICVKQFLPNRAFDVASRFLPISTAHFSRMLKCSDINHA